VIVDVPQIVNQGPQMCTERRNRELMTPRLLCQSIAMRYLPSFPLVGRSDHLRPIRHGELYDLRKRPSRSAIP
jgi:hypothetical protein